jgi:hypothetical protein
MTQQQADLGSRSLVLPSIRCTLRPKTPTKKSAKKKTTRAGGPMEVVAIVHHTPDTAYEAQYVEHLVAEHKSLIAKAPNSFIFPDANRHGSWKWDLMNRLDVMEQRKRGKKELTLIYVRVGYINKKVLTESH